MRAINELPSWYDNWKTGGFGEDDRDMPEEETVHCDICGKEIYACKGFVVDGEYWCEDCYYADEESEVAET